MGQVPEFIGLDGVVGVAGVFLATGQIDKFWSCVPERRYGGRLRRLCFIS